MLSPDSLRLKLLVKMPMLVFANVAAMMSSMSEMFMKIIGCILKDAQEWTDYAYLIIFVPCLAFTGARTLVYINYGIKYYDQLEMMPIYQTCLLLHNILVGMICLDEVKFYTKGMLLGILFSIICCMVGISFLLEKNKEKRAALRASQGGDEMADGAQGVGPGAGQL